MEQSTDYKLQHQFDVGYVVNKRQLSPQNVNMFVCVHMEQFRLSDHVVSAETVNTFKNRLDRFWSNQDVLYDYALLDY